MSDADEPQSPREDESELGAGLSSLREDVGLPPAEGKELDAPLVSINLPIDDLADRVTELVKARDGRWGLFRWEDAVVTIDEAKGKPKVMGPKRFRTWLPKCRGILPVKRMEEVKDSADDSGLPKRRPVKGEFKMEQADGILHSDGLLAKLPELKGINRVRLPMIDRRDRDERGVPKLRLLEHGFDPGSGIYTLQTGLDYPTDMAFDEAVNYLWNLFRYFGWRDKGRDFAIHLAAAITMFARGVYAGKAPAFVYNANIQDSGKTTLAKYVVWLVYGEPATRPLLRDNEAKLEEALNANAKAGKPYIFFDNIDWKGKTVETVLLDEWISNTHHEFRILGGQNEAEVELRGVTLMTGNRLTLSSDLDRRSLMVDLLNRTAGSERELPKDATLLDAEFFEEEENRKMGLAALWAILREWDKAGRPKGPEKPLNSFEGWGRVVPGIVHHAGQAGGGQEWNCMAENSNEEVGDKLGSEYKQLAEFALHEFGYDLGEPTEMQEAFSITVVQFAGVARRNGVATKSLWPELDVESVLSTEGKSGGFTFSTPPGSTADPEEAAVVEKEKKRAASEWLSPKTRSAFGNALKNYFHERWFKGPDGFQYEFRHRMKVSPARYDITRVKV